MVKQPRSNEARKNESQRIEQAIERIEREKPSLEPIAEAMKEVLVSRATLKARIPLAGRFPLPTPDPKRHSEGRPVLDREGLAALADPWGETAAATIGSLARAFPGIAAEARRLQEALDRGEADLPECLRALMQGDEGGLDRIAGRLAVPAPVLGFLLGQMLKPFVEKRTEPLQAQIRRLPWHRGFCPVCGSLPEITFLQGEEGQRWLRCSLCACEYPFNRMLCPHCEAQGQKKSLIRVQGRPHEFAELYAGCRRYIVGIDLREAKRESITPASAVGLVHLDIMAQEKGYSPMAVCAWNMVGQPGPEATGGTVDPR